VRRATRLACACATPIAALGAGIAAGAPLANHGLTISATPQAILSGEGVLVYGQLNGHRPPGSKVVLHRRVGGASAFTIEGSTVTNGEGFYEFAFSEGVVTGNRSWYVTSPGAGNLHSRTVDERVASLLTLSASSATGETGQAVTFSGSVSPTGHAGEPVLLQEQAGSGWRTLDHGTIDVGSKFAITRTFVVPGAYTLRAMLGADARNTRGESDSQTVVIQQAQHPSFTISSSAPVSRAGAAVTISGILDTPGAVKPLARASVTLWGQHSGGAFARFASTTTALDGSYQFTQSPSYNEVYQARTTSITREQRRTARLFEAVASVVTLDPVPGSAHTGSDLTVTGTVTPDEAGHVVKLEQLGTDGSWQVAANGAVNAASEFNLTITLGTQGTQEFRVVVVGGDGSVGAPSAPVTVAVTLPPLSSLPPAS